MRKHNVDVVAGGLAATVSTEFDPIKATGSFQEHEHIPAYDGADTAGLHGIQVIHDGGIDGLNLFARYTVRESTRHFGTILGVRTSVQLHCVT
jgi:hypothetical protein